MSLKHSSELKFEKSYPVNSLDFFFFDRMRPRFFNDLSFMGLGMGMPMDLHFDLIRNNMFQLAPFETLGNGVFEITPSHPFVDDNGETKLKLDFNVHGFKPEEVEVKVVGDNVLQIVATSDVSNGRSETKRRHVSQYTLPAGVLADKIKPVMSKDGVLTIEAPAPEIKVVARQVPVELVKA